MTEPLFHVELPQATPAVDVTASADRRCTQNQHALLRKGFHPLTVVVSAPLRLHPDAAPADDRKAAGLRCRGCRFRVLVNWHNQPYPKCVYGKPDGAYVDKAPRVSHGAATDCRRWWPACSDYQPKDPL